MSQQRKWQSKIAEGEAKRREGEALIREADNLARLREAAWHIAA
jgi:hypothetical protein